MDLSTLITDDLLLEDVFDLKKDNLKCISFLQHVGLLPKTKDCEQCHTSMALKQMNITDGCAFRCYKCKKKVSIRKGTFFEGAKLSLWQVFFMMYVDINDIGMSYDMLMKQAKISSRETICDWKNYIREIYIEYFNMHRSPIGGIGVIVQIDESQICKRKYHRGRVLVNQSFWIVGGIDSNGNLFQVLTELRNRIVLEEIITENCIRGSTLWTDKWPAYWNLSNLGYIHDSVNHSIEFKTADGVHTNRIEAIWGAIKRKFRYITNKKPDLMPSYLADYHFKKIFPNNAISIYIKTINDIYLHLCFLIFLPDTRRQIPKRVIVPYFSR